MRNAYLRALYDLAVSDRNVLALVADNGAVVYDRFRRDLPEQFINFGISEANMVSVAAGLAACGKIPFAYTISNFLTMRAFEQVRNDICLQRMNVKLVGIGAGFIYSQLGPTHHATEDISLMRALPGMTIFAPADPLEAVNVTQAAARIDGPVYIRLGTGNTPALYEGKYGEDYDFEVGRGVVLCEGHDATVIATGQIVHEALRAAEVLTAEGLRVRVINIHTIKPIDRELILQAASETAALVTLEEHTTIGGLGSAVAEVLQEGGAAAVPFRRLGLPGVFSDGYGSYEEMKALNHLTAGDVAGTVRSLLGTVSV